MKFRIIKCPPFSMAVFYSGMTDREVSALTECMIRSGETVDLSSIAGTKVDKHSTGGVGDKTSLISAPLAAAAGAVVPMISGRGLGHTGGTLDNSRPFQGFRTDLTIDEFREQLKKLGLAFIGQTPEVTPADGKLYALRNATATVESIPLIASSIMSKKLAVGLDAVVLDVKVGNGAFMKKQVDARRLAQMMWASGAAWISECKRCITDMNQPLGYAVGNALEVMEVSQTLQNAGPTDLTRISLELAARMIFLAKIVPTLDEARELASRSCWMVRATGNSRKLSRPKEATRRCSIASSCCPTPRRPRDRLASRRIYQRDRRRGHRDGVFQNRRRPHTKEIQSTQPWVFILEVKVGQKVDAGAFCARLLHSEEHVDEAAGQVEDAFRISAQPPEEREVNPGSGKADPCMDRFTGILGILAILLTAFLFSKHKRAIRPSVVLWGLGLQLVFCLQSFCEHRPRKLSRRSAKK